MTLDKSGLIAGSPQSFNTLVDRLDTALATKLTATASETAASVTAASVTAASAVYTASLTSVIAFCNSAMTRINALVTLANDNKAKINALKAKLQTAGIMES